MKTDLRMLDEVQIAKPCPANWDEMKGDERVRHCSLCRLNVYNLSEMDGKSALALVQKAEGRMCVRFYRREDGTMITRECPNGLKAFRQRAVKRLALAASFMLSAVGCGPVGDRLKEDFGIAKTPAPPSHVSVMVGAIAVRPTSTPPTTHPVAKAKKP